MLLSKEEVEHIAMLARLNLSEEEKERYREQLSSILGHVAQLQDLNTDDVEPLVSVLAKEMPLREDLPSPGLSLKEATENAPDVKADQFKVPPILDGADE